MHSFREKEKDESLPSIYMLPTYNPKALEDIKNNLVNADELAIIFSPCEIKAEEAINQSNYSVLALYNGTWILNASRAFNIHMGKDTYKLNKKSKGSTIKDVQIKLDSISNIPNFHSIMDKISEYIASTKTLNLSAADISACRGEIMRYKAITLKSNKDLSADLLRLFLESISCFETVLLEDRENKCARKAINNILAWLQGWEETTSVSFGNLAIHQHIDIAWLYSELNRLKGDLEGAYMALRYLASDHEENQKYVDKLYNDVLNISTNKPLTPGVRQMRTGLLVLKKNYIQAVDELINILETTPSDRIALENLKKCIQGMEKDVGEEDIDHQHVFRRAKAYMFLKKYDQAIEDLTFLIDNENDIDKNLLLVYRAEANRHQYKGEEKALDDLNNIKEPNEAKNKFLKQWLIDLNNSIKGSYRDTDYLMYRAEVNKLLGNLEQALEDIKEPIEYNPENYIALRIRADVYKMMGQYELAITDYDEVIANTDDIKCKINRIESFYLSGDYKSALEAIEKSYFLSNEKIYIRECTNKLISILNSKTEKQPNKASLYVFLALAKNINKKYSDGFNAFDKACRINSKDKNLVESLNEFISKYQDCKDSELLAYCGEANRLLDKIDIALEFYDKSLNHEPNNDVAKGFLNKINLGDNILLKAKKFMILLNYQSGLQAYNQVIRKFPGNEDYHVMRFYIFLKLGRYLEIKDEINQFIDKHPDNLECVRIRGAIKLHLGDYTGAINDLEAYLEENPKNPFALLWNSVAKAKTNNLIGGLKNYVHSLRFINSREYYNRDLLEYLNEVSLLQPPRSHKTHVLIGKILFKLGKYTDVLDEFNLAKLIEPHVGDGITDECFIIQDTLEDKIWENIEDEENSHLYLEAQRLLDYDVISDFENNVENDPNDTFSLSRIAEIKRTDKSKDYEGAQHYFKKAISIDPDHIFSLCRLAEILRITGEYDQSLAMFNHVLVLEPNNTFCLSKRGYIKKLQGSLDSALVDLTLCVNIEPGNYFTWIQLADIKYTLGLYNEALESYTNAGSIKSHDSYVKGRLKQTEEQIEQAKTNSEATKQTKSVSQKQNKNITTALDMAKTRSSNSTSILFQEQPDTTNPNKISEKRKFKMKYGATLFVGPNNSTIGNEQSQAMSDTSSYNSRLRSYKKMKNS